MYNSSHTHNKVRASSAQHAQAGQHRPLCAQSREWVAITYNKFNGSQSHRFRITSRHAALLLLLHFWRPFKGCIIARTHVMNMPAARSMLSLTARGLCGNDLVNGSQSHRLNGSQSHRFRMDFTPSDAALLRLSHFWRPTRGCIIARTHVMNMPAARSMLSLTARGLCGNDLVNGSQSHRLNGSQSHRFRIYFTPCGLAATLALLAPH